MGKELLTSTDDIKSLIAYHFSIPVQLQGAFIIGFDDTVFYMERPKIEAYTLDRDDLISKRKSERNGADYLSDGDMSSISNNIRRRYNVLAVHYPVGTDIDTILKKIILLWERENV